MNGLWNGVTLLAQTATLAVVCALLFDVGSAASLGGRLMRRLRDVFAALLLYMTWWWLGRLDAQFDAFPWLDMRSTTNAYGLLVWLPLLATLMRFWVTLHEEEE